MCRSCGKIVSQNNIAVSKYNATYIICYPCATPKTTTGRALRIQQGDNIYEYYEIEKRR